MKNYTVFEHTADIGLRLEAKDLPSLFVNAGLAIFDLSCEQLKKNTHAQKIPINLKADSLDELFINWLNELLSLSAVKGLIFTDIQMKKIDEKGLEAIASGKKIENYKVNTEIKAATYHELKIVKIQSGWKAKVILDV